ncbi:yrdC domain-containing protein, mitochondrial-like [Sinocyclocheilus grahami]|uniref:yrdC domain-containing protein, mitochondrial-like n=1 Tax=Sinocyclocheilus grahami TaxID=75366 RepID=UPI0007AC6A81|nr:PREDICTED: yrdC domain-containing protein, mitochondrial-like [Sinocyclocheilus grahami]
MPLRSASVSNELKTRVLRLSAQSPGEQQEWTEILSAAVKALKAGQVVAVPTDTIYGLACVASGEFMISKEGMETIL